MYSYEVKKEMDALSQEVLGSKSRWKKMIEQGVAELVEEDTTRLTIVDGVEKKETVRTPVMKEGPNGGEMRQFQLKRYTLEELKEKLIFLKIQKDNMLAALQKQQEDLRAAQELEKAKKAVEVASGSSV
jgi:hypothetical protein